MLRWYAACSKGTVRCPAVLPSHHTWLPRPQIEGANYISAMLRNFDSSGFLYVPYACVHHLFSPHMSAGAPAPQPAVPTC